MIGLTIAGFDPSGGAGILRDINTFRDLDIHGTAVVTALTSQNPNNFYSTKAIEIDFIEEQFDSILEEYEVKYAKTGMLYNSEIANIVYKKLNEYNIQYVVDPVMTASSGGKLSKNSLIDILKTKLLKKAILTTPNIVEAETLINSKIKTVDDSIEASKKIIEITKIPNVLITGGHLNGTSILNINKNEEISIIQNKLINTNNTHGSGCGLSAAIVGFLIKKEPLKIAIEKSNEYISLAIQNGRYGTLK
ncbi:MAG: bifunctional hydroxymethylpyrimidine kinase/phosphomethylpyrimidine kinase [Methanobrevibacter sp.]|jgi:hydroxymethylpyrimidine/phosphomethylpyrimidine kinase|nr:bifunctional hydroxymethylpyrimidine kinase/phosphomethylpyrimidine kinase [Candidatus Methanoflexus mossambicus]